jgi:aspartyl-tRNA(Asn)/glutamyl-tRNA(Gln) amidotransferase subunit C
MTIPTAPPTRVQIDADLVGQVARLARLRLEPSEVAAMAADLEKMVLALDTLATVDVEGVEPMVHPDRRWPALRGDAVATCLPQATLRAMAPDFRADGFVVPRVVE